MSVLPALPNIKEAPRKNHSLTLQANAGWQNFPIGLRPLEKISVTLSGEIVYHYRQWSTSGACGKRKDHVDIRRTQPDKAEGAGVFGLADSSADTPFTQFSTRCQPSLKVDLDESHTLGRQEGMLAGIVADCLNGNGGDNQGSYSLEVTVDWQQRYERLLQELGDWGLKIIQAKEMTDQTGALEVAAQLLRWETPRIVLDSEDQQKFCTQLTNLGRTIINHEKVRPAAQGSFAVGVMLWAQLAAWLGEWSVTESAGGRASHSAGWTLRADVAAMSGDLTAAMDLYAQALQNAEPGPILYKVGKIQEIKGVFFSPKGREVLSLDAIKNKVKDASVLAGIGACDLYELSLGQPVSEFDANGAAKDGGKPSLKGAPPHLAHYDVHYALGRLKFLRHTTRSLTEATVHFRQCTKLARYRAFTNPKLYSQYSLLDLLEDYRRTDQNPFYTRGRVAAENWPALVGFKGLKIELSGQAGGFDGGGPVSPALSSPKIAPLNWIAVTGRPPEPLALVAEGESGKKMADPARDKITAADAALAVATGRTIESLCGGSSLEDSFVRTGDSLIRSLQTAEVEGANQPGTVLRWLQQPSYWLDFTLRHGFGGLEQTSPWDLLDFKSPILTDVTPGANGSSVRLDFVMTGQQLKISANCRLVDKGLRIQEVTMTEGGMTQTVVLEYDNERLPSTDDRLDALAVYMGGPALTADQKKDPLFQLTLTYHETFERLVTKVEISDRRIRDLLTGITTSDNANNALLNTLRGLHWNWQVQLKLDTPDTACLGEGLPSLASAYIPNVTSVRPELYRQVEANEMRWLLAQQIPGVVANAVVLELGRRILEQPSMAGETRDVTTRAADAAAVLFDVMVGSYDLDQPAENAAAFEVAKAAACSALLSAQGTTTVPEVQAYAGRAAQTAMDLLGTLAGTRDASARAALLTSLNAFPLRLLDLDLPPVLQFAESENTTAAVAFEEEVAADRPAEDAPPRRQPKAEWGHEKQLTLRWLDTFAEVVAADDAPAAWWLAKALVANGLADLALSWLSSVNLRPSLAAGQALDWLSARALPSAPPEPAVAAILQRALDYSLTLDSLAALNTRLYASGDFFVAGGAGAGGSQVLAADVVGLFRTIYAALGYGLDVPWKTVEAARADALECGEQVLKRLISEIVRVGSKAAARAATSVIYYLFTLEVPLQTDKDKISLREEHATLRDVAHCGRILRAVANKPFDAANAENNAVAWKEMVRLYLPVDHPHRKLLMEAGAAPIAAEVAKYLSVKAAWMRDCGMIQFLSTTLMPPAPVTDATAKPAQDAGVISVVEMNAANYNSWELVLNDEPYTDTATALLALANRHTARRETETADRLLQEAASLLSRLELDESDHVSPEDRWQVGPMLRRVKLRLAWLAQGRDSYGRFMTQAPPRRLNVLVNQFARHLEQYDEYLKDARERTAAAAQYRRQSLMVDLQKTQANHSARQAEREIQKCKRLIAHAQVRISAQEMRLSEMRSEMARGERQYKKGKDTASKAVGDIGALALKAASAYLPVPASVTDLGLNSKKLIDVVTTVNDLASGKPPFQTIAAAYGQDLIQMSFASLDAPALLKGTLQKGVQDAMTQFTSTGSVDLKNLSQRTMQRLGEDLFKTSCARLGDYLENDLPQTAFYADARKQWDNIKKKVTTTLGADLDIQRLRQLVNRTGIDVDTRVKVLSDVLQKAGEGVKKLKSQILAGELAPGEIVRSFRKLSAETGADFKSAKEQAEQALQQLGGALLDPKNWWKLAGLDAVAEENLPKLKAALRTSCGRYAEMLEVWSSILLKGTSQLGEIDQKARKALDKGIQDFADNTAGAFDLLASLLADINVPLQRLQIEITTLDSGGSALAKKIIAQLPKDPRSVNQAEYREIFRYALQSAKEEAQTMAGNTKEAATAAFHETCAIVAKGLRAAEIELATRVGDEAKETLSGIKTAFDEAMQKQMSGVAGDLKTALSSLLGRHLPSLDRMMTGLVDRSEKTLEKALESAGNKVFGKGEALVDLMLGKTNEATTQILCYLEKDPGCKIPVPNGMLEVALNAGLQPVTDPRVKANGTPQLDKTIGQPVFELAKVEAKFTVDVARLEDKDGLIKELSAEALMPELLKSEGVQPRLALLEKEPNPITPKPGQPTVAPNENRGEDDPSEPDELSTLLGNPGVQVLVAAISTSIPAVGLAVQAVSIVNNWLCGTTEQNAGAKKATEAMAEARLVDQALLEARQRRELAELELLAAEDSLSAAHDLRRDLERLSNFDAAIADQDVYLQRMVFRQMSASVELITYDLYVLQRAFEYEFDAKLEEIFNRWPALLPFRPLLELSPGALAGEFDRTNVHQDLLNDKAQVAGLPAVVQLVRDLAMGTRYRNARTFSLKKDFAGSWARFQKGSPLLLQTRLRDFIGLAPTGRPLRHSVKIKSVRVDTVFAALKAADKVANDPSSSGFQYQLVAPEKVGQWRGDLETARSTTEALLSRDFANRLGWAVFHCGEGWQVDDSGALQWVEWGPQVVDSNYPAEEPESYYNALEGLTPASRWIIDYDRSTGILAEHIDDLLLTVEFTYGMIEENVRHAHAGISGMQVPWVDLEPVPAGLQDEMETPNTDSSLVRALARRQIQAVHQRPV